MPQGCMSVCKTGQHLWNKYVRVDTTTASFKIFETNHSTNLWHHLPKFLRFEIIATKFHQDSFCCKQLAHVFFVVPSAINFDDPVMCLRSFFRSLQWLRWNDSTGMDGLNDKGLIIFAWSQREAYCLLPLAVVGKVKDVLKKEGHKCIIGNKTWTLNESSKMYQNVVM